MQWASANGVTLTISVISPGDKNYDPSQEGLVVEQSVRYGDLISEKPSGSITVTQFYFFSFLYLLVFCYGIYRIISQKLFYT